MGDEVTIAQAARILGTSERSVRRRLENGTIQSRLVNGRRVVCLPDAAPVALGASADAELRARLEAAEGRLAEVQAERDFLRRHTEQLAYALAQQRALPAPEVEPPRRPWWERLFRP